MTIWTGGERVCFWSYWHGDHTQADVDAYLQASEAFGKKAPGHTVLLTIVFRAQVPNGHQRQQFVDSLKRSDLSRLKAHALVSESPAVRGVATVINWFMTKPFEERIFSSPTDGAAWLAEKVPIDPAQVMREIIAAVPPAKLWGAIPSLAELARARAK